LFLLHRGPQSPDSYREHRVTQSINVVIKDYYDPE
jgi:hypothetical protein